MMLGDLGARVIKVESCQGDDTRGASQQLNPRLVIVSISGFGHDGPEGGRSGYAQITQREAGLMSLTGPGPEDPQKVGVPTGDLLAGMHGAYGVMGKTVTTAFALFQRVPPPTLGTRPALREGPQAARRPPRRTAWSRPRSGRRPPAPAR
jgi:crotonobetainyl-CoA:carnitine CoA-transferase CaiB-like acyl-CoA transferase